jgi:CysZ protein
MSSGRKRVGVSDGLGAVGGGIGFIVANPSVWGYALVPIAWLIVLLCGLGIVGVWGAWRGSWALLGTELSWWGHVGGWLLSALLAVVALVLALVLAVVLAQPLSGFALEAIARAREQALTGWTPEPLPLAAALFMSARVALATLLVGGSALGVLLVVGFLVPPAALVMAPLNFLVGSWLLAWNFLDYPLSLHGLGLRARLRWAGRNFGAFTAFGVLWAFLLVVPGMFLLVLPMGVAGATELVVTEDDPWRQPE